MAVELAFHMALLLLYPFLTEAQPPPSGCERQCGSIDIPFPFGMQSGCYLEQRFRINCTLGSTPFLADLNLEVMHISVQESNLQVRFPIVYDNCPNKPTQNSSFIVNLEGTPFAFSAVYNRFTAAGCNNLALLTQNYSTIGGCMSICEDGSIDTSSFNNTCNGVSCCQTTIPSNLKIFNATLRGIDDRERSGDPCKFAYIGNQGWLSSNRQTPFTVRDIEYVPVALDWTIDNWVYDSLLKNSLGPNSTGIATFRCGDFTSNSNITSNQSNIRCHCNFGFEGNPYLRGGCQDVDECANVATVCYQQRMKCENLYGSYNCYSPSSRTKMIILGTCVGFGSLISFIVAWWLYKILKRRRNEKLKEKFFKQNGGLLLQEQLASGEANVDKIKMFSSRELEKATDYYNVNRTLGHGGQGTVYKGMLADGRIVAVKKSKILNDENLRQFINEVVILSQINHRNVVKLLGCCLETEVPLLVYEFIPNGTLYTFLHDQNEEIPSTWDMRLRIAAEVAGALFYLHSAASMPIYHRDIKSTNILLDDKYRAKVADFGISRSITVDQTHVTTIVQGTFGYLDPEYFQSSQFTDKSDVYSFGVVLVELLTGQKPISETRSEECRGLVAYFILSMANNRVFEIVDDAVMKQGNREDIVAVANLAKRCLDLNGKKRPTMKEAAVELERIQKTTPESFFNVPRNHQVQQVTMFNANETILEPWELSSTSIESGVDSLTSSTTGSSLYMKPLLPKH